MGTCLVTSRPDPQNACTYAHSFYKVVFSMNLRTWYFQAFSGKVARYGI